MQKMSGVYCLFVGATTEVATLRQALSEAEKKEAMERTARGKFEA